MKIAKRLTLILIIMMVSISFSQVEVFASELSETEKLVCPDGSTTASGCGTATTLAKKIETVVKTLTGLVGALAKGKYLTGSEKRKFQKIEKELQEARADIDKLSNGAIKKRVKNRLSESAKYAKGKKWTKAGLAGIGVGAGLLGVNELLLKRKASE